MNSFERDQQAIQGGDTIEVISVVRLKSPP